MLLPKSKADLHRTSSVCSSEGHMGRIDLLSCSLAQDGGKNNPLVLALEDLTGFNVCASTDMTGAKAKGDDAVKFIYFLFHFILKPNPMPMSHDQGN